MTKTIALLGATGSVGMQTLEVARAGGYKIDFISAGRNSALAERIVREFRPTAVAMSDVRAANELKFRIRDCSVRVLSGEQGICEGVLHSNADTVVNAILGKAGLMPTLASIEAGKRLALANKESLVIAGNIVMDFARRKGVEIIPVDSEHSAIFQSLKAGNRSEIRRLILTASGGPFYGRSMAELERITVADTLAHPTWKMGKKITVDSATLMNKGFEIIEAAHLFSVSPDRIEVVVHPESILHSAVEYIDNSIIGELSVPDMRMCVQYAVDYPDRFESTSRELDLFELGTLSFFRPDNEAFPFLDLAKEAITLGGAMPAVMNAADEVAVAAFLDGRISFTDIFRVVTATFDSMRDARCAVSLDDIIASDRAARKIAAELI